MLRYHSMTNSVPTTDVMYWNEKSEKWENLWDMCPVISTSPYIFRDSEGYLWEAISIVDTPEYRDLKDSMPKEFWEGQPKRLKRV